MALILVETAGATNANTYATLIEGNTYFETKYHNSVWDEADDEVQLACLAWATRLLDQQINWDGYKYTDTQSLRWPRSGVLDADGYEVDYLTIPQWLKNATAEYAEFLIANDRTAEDDTRGFKKMKVGSLELTIDKTDRKDEIPASVYEMIKDYGSRRSAKSNKLVRV